MDAGIIIQQMAILLGMMIVGYVACKVNIIDELGTRYLTGLVLNVTLPFLTFHSFLNGNLDMGNWDVIRILLISTLTFLLMIGAAYILAPLLHCPIKKQYMYRYMIVFGNVGFMGFPVTVAVFGQEKLIYAIIYNMMFNLLTNSLGLLWVSASGSKKVALNWRLFWNMPLVSSVVAIILFFCHVVLPETVLLLCEPIGNMTTPLAMLMIGAAIGQMPLKSLFKEWSIYPFTVIKLFAMPLLIWAVYRHMAIIPRDVANVMIVLAGTPVATNATMLSIRYGGDKELAARGIFFTTLLCVFTIPAVALFLC